MIGERSPGMRAEVVHLDAMPDVSTNFCDPPANCWVQSYDKQRALAQCSRQINTGKAGMAIPTSK